MGNDVSTISTKSCVLLLFILTKTAEDKKNLTTHDHSQHDNLSWASSLFNDKTLEMTKSSPARNCDIFLVSLTV